MCVCVCILLQVQPLQWPMSLNWRQGKDLPIEELVWASSVVIDGAVYCGGNDPYSHDVVQGLRVSLNSPHLLFVALL